MAKSFVFFTPFFCILMVMVHGANKYSNVVEPEVLSRIYRTAVKNKEPVILMVFNNDPNYLRNKLEANDNDPIFNLQHLIKSVHHKNYLENRQKLDPPKSYKHGSLRDNQAIESKQDLQTKDTMLKAMLRLRNEIQCVQKEVCEHNCKAAAKGVDCKSKCDMSFDCNTDSKNNQNDSKKDDKDDCDKTDSCDECSNDCKTNQKFPGTAAPRKLLSNTLYE